MCNWFVYGWMVGGGGGYLNHGTYVLVGNSDYIAHVRTKIGKNPICDCSQSN